MFADLYIIAIFFEYRKFLIISQKHIVVNLLIWLCSECPPPPPPLTTLVCQLHLLIVCLWVIGLWVAWSWIIRWHKLFIESACVWLFGLWLQVIALLVTWLWIIWGHSLRKLSVCEITGYLIISYVVVNYMAESYMMDVVFYGNSAWLLEFWSLQHLR